MSETKREPLQLKPDHTDRADDDDQAPDTIFRITNPKPSTKSFEQGIGEENNLNLCASLTERNSSSDSPRNLNCDKVEMQELISRSSSIEPKWNHYILENIDSFVKPKPTGSLRKALLLYILLAFVSFVFLLTSSCPVPWYRGKISVVDGINYRNYRFTIWGVEGGRMANFGNRYFSDNCLLEIQFYRVIAIATITACAFCLISIITATLRMCGYGHYGWTILFASISCLGAFAAAMFSLDLFHTPCCDKPVLDHIANLDAGFLLTLNASFFMFMGMISLVAITGGNVVEALKCVRRMDIFFLVVLLFSLLLLSVGSISTIWEREFNGPLMRTVKVSYWDTNVLLYNGTHSYYTHSQYNCPFFRESVRFNVILLSTGSIALFIASLLAVFAVLISKMRVISCIIAGLASVCLCISWGYSISILHRTFCKHAPEGTQIENHSGMPFESGGGYTKFEGYTLHKGVVFVIIASILSFSSAVLNLLMH